MAAKDRNAPLSGGAQSEPRSLPLDGFTRWNDLRCIVPLSHEAVRLRERDGRFPKRVQLGSARCVGWPNRELHRWLADPAGYRVEG
ncbi:AlpA family transcriptional regulator [Burkholderia seminalis]|uniref:helix-turn-helix transcriptional regulator n=1 Tax=Burkholderia seminalis TaxID=488731 RepID=UPI001CF4FC4F|nr:AlpA family phage regulatory protein [Burkholderia seminalis]MCA8422049.1 AlpA family transcriptional regulator [Burkholderia seminalis]